MAYDKDNSLSPEAPRGDPLNDPKRRSLTFGALLVIGVGALAFGVFSFFNTLNSPFRPQDTGDTTNISFALQNENSSSLESLRSKDTDQDGMNDYDELYVYQTSPYLADSDSDGASDKAEVDRQSDPNCPEGQSCRQPSITNTVGGENSNVASGDSALSMDLLRESLKSAGAPENIINNLTDAELLDLYDQVVAEDGGAVPTDANTNQPSTVSATDLQNLTPDEIRAFLVQSGVDKSLIDSVDDETLKAIFEQAINEQS